MHFLALIVSLQLAVAAILDPSTAASGKSPQIALSNKITACPGKVQREQQLLTEFLDQVRQNEPGVLEFELSLAPQDNVFLTYEIYANQHAIDIHLNTTYFAHLINAEQAEGTKCANNSVIIPLSKVYSIRRGH
ncbi:hypothetical protein K461DRAFT_296661 [Myriangium duriaei CBS 260.36]|uniref:ABM domain-containing protein n=1 Tax=Myriangium duriaei CBS 260.36 TaxID=1168546 RepID=A0A9P4MGQ0_9PEZI|nr:hypothetical protein K461DRAFT_296661 [Myriangium duriaei CBS 260.36]